jgi:hypothetical protein
MRFTSFFLFFLFSIHFQLFAQDRFDLKGKISATGSGNYLSGAEVIIFSADSHVISAKIAGTDGSFTFSLPKGNYRLFIKYLGYHSHFEEIILNKNHNLQIKLKEVTLPLEEVEVKSFKIPEEIRQAQIGVEKLDIKQVERLPSILGEPDILRILQLTGGVQAGGEGISGIFVRGGSHDQNLFLWDDAPLYSVNHMFGLLSIFNPDVVQSLELYKAGFPAKYGGRLSSVIDIKSRSGNSDSSITSIGIGLISSRIAHERPFAAGKGSVIASARRTYFDIFTRTINRLNREKENFNPIPSYSFHDLNLKLDYQLSANTSAFVSAYYGDDNLNYLDKINYENLWGNSSLSVGINNQIKGGTILQHRVFYSRYRYGIRSFTDDFELDLNSSIRDIGFKTLAIIPWRKHILNTGIQLTNHKFQPQNIVTVSNSLGLHHNTGEESSSYEAGIFLSDEWNLTEKLGINYGIRLSSYLFDTTLYMEPEPRFTARYSLSPNAALKASYTRMHQYMHLVSNGMASMPTDIWYPATGRIKPQSSDLYAAGIHKFFPAKGVELINEIYYKNLSGIVEYAEGADILFQPDFESQMVSGRGYSYGNEISLKKSTDTWSGWISYTLSWSRRQFDEKNFGNWYFSNFDRRHYLNVVGDYQLGKRTNLGASWVFASGNAATLPVGRVVLNNVFPYTGSWIMVFSTKNDFRMPSFHHLDLNLKYKLNGKKFSTYLVLSCYNVYNKRNTFYIHLKNVKNENNEIIQYKYERVSLLPLIPTISLNIKI